MTVAVRIYRNVNASPPPYNWQSTDFYEHEIRQAPINPGQHSITKTLGNGQPKLINRQGFDAIEMIFKLFTADTLNRLKQIANHTGDQRFLIYPAMIDDPEYYKIVSMPAGQIPEQLFVGGRKQGLQELKIKFLEIEKPGGALELHEEDI